MRRRRRRAGRAAALLLVGAALTGAGAAHADTVSGTRSSKLHERSHEIVVTLDHGHATLRVRRGLYNGGERHDQAELWIDVPETAVATGLRTRGELAGRPRWFAGKLLEAELAAARYRELTGIGGYYPKDPALLSWRSQERLALQVFPVAPSSEKMIEYTFTMPARYEDGRYRVHLPQLGTGERTATYTLEPAHPRDQLFIGDRPVVSGKQVIPGRDGFELSLGRADAPWIEGRLGVSSTGERSLVHFALDGSREFSKIPDNAHVVVVIDASRSRAEDDLGASYSAARAYIDSFQRAQEAPGAKRGRKGARVELLTFDRAVHRHTRGFEKVAKAAARLEGLERDRGNGSALDEALAEAGRLLARAPRGAPRRVLVISDLIVRTGLEVERVAALSKQTGAIVHVARVSDSSPRVIRDDDGSWDRVARVTGGLLWRAAANERLEAVDAEHRELFEEWARPRQIDKLSVVAQGAAELSHPEIFREGQGFEWFELRDASVKHVRVQGELWSAPVSEVFTPRRAEGELWSALVFGGELLDELSEAEMMPLALRGGAVSPVTSYLAIEPGVRPSTEGLEWGEGSGAGFGGFGRRVPRVRQARARVAGAPPDRQGWLEDQLGHAWRVCGGQGRVGAVELESTWREVVEVRSVTVEGAPEPVLETCVREASWGLDLPPMFTQARMGWTVRLR